jgi:hypothetical protein
MFFERSFEIRADIVDSGAVNPFPFHSSTLSVASVLGSTTC